MSISSTPSPTDPATPPTTLPLSLLPQSSQRALTSPANILMPVDPSAENVEKDERDRERGKGKEKDGVKNWVEGVDYAYEYVAVSQRKEGRKNITYEMKMRQQPVQARMCGVGEKSDRRPVDPTPIIQLKVIDGNGEDVTTADPSENGKRRALRRPEGGPQGMTFMQNPYYFLFACLVGGDDQEDELHVIDDGKTRFLTGTPVSSLYHLKDLDNSDSAFFVFPDLGVRKEGRYKLKLTLFEIVDQEVFYCTTMFTSTFSVFSAKKFPGMQRATDLSKSFADQGLKIRVRKDPRKRSGKPKRKSSTNDSTDEVTDTQSKRPRTQSLSVTRQPPYPDPNYYHPSGSYPYGPSQGGYHPYPPGPGQQMAPPPVPYDPYRMSTPYHPNPGRPLTNPGPSRGSLPPQGYHPEHPQSNPGYPPNAYHPPPPPPSQSNTYSPNVPWPQQDRRARPNSSRHPPRGRTDEPPKQPAREAPVRLPPLVNPPVLSKRPILPPPTQLAQRAEGESTSSNRSSLGDGLSAAGSLKVSEESPVTTPGGTKVTNRMGLGHLMD